MAKDSVFFFDKSRNFLVGKGEMDEKWMKWMGKDIKKRCAWMMHTSFSSPLSYL